jgi:hypothetical protein
MPLTCSENKFQNLTFECHVDNKAIKGDLDRNFLKWQKNDARNSVSLTVPILETLGIAKSTYYQYQLHHTKIEKNIVPSLEFVIRVGAGTVNACLILNYRGKRHI